MWIHVNSVTYFLFSKSPFLFRICHCPSHLTMTKSCVCNSELEPSNAPLMVWIGCLLFCGLPSILVIIHTNKKQLRYSCTSCHWDRKQNEWGEWKWNEIIPGTMVQVASAEMQLAAYKMIGHRISHSVMGDDCTSCTSSAVRADWALST